MAGDFDGSGEVSQADYGIWSSTVGSTADRRADATGNGRVDAADYVLWRKNATGGVSVTTSGFEIALSGVHVDRLLEIAPSDQHDALAPERTATSVPSRDPFIHDRAIRQLASGFRAVDDAELIAILASTDDANEPLDIGGSTIGTIGAARAICDVQDQAIETVAGRFAGWGESPLQLLI
jgi:hypothetical protein